MFKPKVPLDQDMQACLDSLSSRSGEIVDETQAIKYLFLDRLVPEILRELELDLGPYACGELVRRLMTEDIGDLRSLVMGVSRHLEPRKYHTYEYRLGPGEKPQKRVKRAYPDPSIYRVEPLYAGKQKDFPSLCRAAQMLMASGVKESDALKRVISKLDLDDRLDFLTWYGIKMRFGKNLKYLAATGDKMNDEIKKTAYGAGEGVGSDFAYEFYRQKEQAESDPVAMAAKDAAGDNKAQQFGAMRDKMVGRTFAIDRLLEKYRTLLTEEQAEAIEDSLNVLRKSIRKLKMATLQDSIVKVARVCEDNNWNEGAILVERIADEDFNKIAAKVSSPESMQAVLDSLEEISGMLRQRGIIRELSARDIDLFNLGYGHISEIGDASAKLMEAFNGAANKIDDVISRLRSEVQQQLAPKVTPDTVKTVVDPRELPLAKEIAGPTPEVEDGTVSAQSKPMPLSLPQGAGG